MIFLVICITFANGCANWKNIFQDASSDVAETKFLKQSAMSRDSVVLEISIINLPANAISRIEDYFQTLDTTRIPLDQRKNWDRNGMRVAAGGANIPQEFEQILANEIKKENNESGSEETKMAPRRRIQARSGKPFRVATRPVATELAWFVTQKDGYRTGGTKASAQTEFEVRAYPKGDGSVKLGISPEIMFGEPKQVVTTSQASFRYEMKREAITFPHMRLEADLALGESLILAAQTPGPSSKDSPEAYGLGQAFFTGKQGENKLIVIRLAQSQKDDLFDPSQESQPLESVTEQ